MNAVWIVVGVVACLVILLTLLVLLAGSRQRYRLNSIRGERAEAQTAIDRLTMQALRSMLEEARRSSSRNPWDN